MATPAAHCELYFRRLMEALPAGAYTCDAEGLITYFNPRAVEVWGRAPRLNDPVDRYCGSFRLFTTDGDPISHDRCWMALAIQEERSFNGREIVVEQPDGNRLTALAHANPIHDEEGKLVGAINVLVDISEQREAQAALRASEERLREINQSLEEEVQRRTGTLVEYQRRLRELAARLGEAEQKERKRVATSLHDNLAQLLAVSRMRLSAVRAGATGADANDFIASAEVAIEEALNFTRELVSDLTPPFGVAEDDLGTAVKWAAEKMSRHGLAVEVDDDGRPKPAPPALVAAGSDSVRELLFNVLRHSGVTSARVIMRTENGKVRLRVEDAGRGFDPAVGSPAPSSDGGYGLFSVRERMMAAGGEFALDSRPGHGTSVTLTLPISGRLAQADSNGAP